MRCSGRASNSTTSPHSSSGAPTTASSAQPGGSSNTSPPSRGVDIAAAADHDVFGAVTQREISPFVERAHVAGVKPAVLQGAARGIGVVPVAGHHRVTAADDLTDFAGVHR